VCGLLLGLFDGLSVQHSLPVRHGVARHLLVRVQRSDIVLDLHHLALEHLHTHTRQ